MNPERVAHWNKAYAEKGETGVSWYEASADFSLDLIERFGGTEPLSVIDIGGGASRLVDGGLMRGWRMAVLDLSQTAIDTARRRLGEAAGSVEWIVADVTSWKPQRSHDVWHDRAALHFLTGKPDRSAYAECLRAALRPGGIAVIATFVLDGPQRCSGLPVRRYSPELLAAELGEGFSLEASFGRMHETPWGTQQSFQYSVLRQDRA